MLQRIGKNYRCRNGSPRQSWVIFVDLLSQHLTEALKKASPLPRMSQPTQRRPSPIIKILLIRWARVYFPDLRGFKVSHPAIIEIEQSREKIPRCFHESFQARWLVQAMSTTRKSGTTPPKVQIVIKIGHARPRNDPFHFLPMLSLAETLLIKPQSHLSVTSVASAPPSPRPRSHTNASPRVSKTRSIRLGKLH